MTGKVSYPKKLPGSFRIFGLVDALLNKFAYPGLGGSVDFVPRDPSWGSFKTPGSFLLR